MLWLCACVVGVGARAPISQRSYAQFLSDALFSRGIPAPAVFTATSKRELFAIARMHGVNLHADLQRDELQYNLRLRGAEAQPPPPPAAAAEPVELALQLPAPSSPPYATQTAMAGGGSPPTDRQPAVAPPDRQPPSAASPPDRQPAAASPSTRLRPRDSRDSPADLQSPIGALIGRELIAALPPLGPTSLPACAAARATIHGAWNKIYSTDLTVEGRTSARRREARLLQQEVRREERERSLEEQRQLVAAAQTLQRKLRARKASQTAEQQREATLFLLRRRAAAALQRAWRNHLRRKYGASFSDIVSRGFRIRANRRKQVQLIIKDLISSAMSQAHFPAKHWKGAATQRNWSSFGVSKSRVGLVVGTSSASGQGAATSGGGGGGGGTPTRPASARGGGSSAAAAAMVPPRSPKTPKSPKAAAAAAVGAQTVTHGQTVTHAPTRSPAAPSSNKPSTKRSGAPPASPRGAIPKDNGWSTTAARTNSPRGTATGGGASKSSNSTGGGRMKAAAAGAGASARASRTSAAK